jgi:hypothetical protein
MAWLLSDKPLARYLPRVATRPTGPELVQWQSEYGRARPDAFPRLGQWTKQGVHIPTELLPASGQVTSSHKTLPDHFSLGGLGFSQRLKDLVEELEPRVHQFKEVPLAYATGQPVPGKYYAVVLGHMANNQVVTSLSTIEANTSTALSLIRIPTTKDQNRICIDRSASPGWHMWYAWDIYSKILISNELYARMMSAQIASFDFIEMREINS